MSGWQEKLWKRVLITNGIERAEYASRTPAVEAILFRDHIKSYYIGHCTVQLYGKRVVICLFREEIK